MLSVMLVVIGVLSSPFSSASAGPGRWPVIADWLERTGCSVMKTRSGPERNRVPGRWRVPGSQACAGWASGKPKVASRPGSANTVIRVMAVLVVVSTTIPYAR